LAWHPQTKEAALFKSRAMTIVMVIIAIISCTLLDILLMGYFLGSMQPAP
jgi:hypothetical protein